MSYSLDFLKGGVTREYMGDYFMWKLMGDTRSSDS